MSVFSGLGPPQGVLRLSLFSRDSFGFSFMESPADGSSYPGTWVRKCGFPSRLAPVYIIPTRRWALLLAGS